MSRLFCRIFGHRMATHDVGQGTGVTVFHCRRCPHFWTLS